MVIGTENLPIGVFDSGVGGLTVLAALRRVLPMENYIYLGDTARLPYGTKSTETVTRYAVQAARKLVDQKVKLLVIACNTATAAALPILQKTFSDIPVIGVVEPGAQAACAVTHNKKILIIGTESTINNKAYQKTIQRIRPDCHVEGLACPLFVPLAEEGWVGCATGSYAEEENAIARAVAVRYLAKAILPKDGESDGPDCLVLGCTHFLPFSQVIRSVVGEQMQLVDSAQTTATVVAQLLAATGRKSTCTTQGVINFMTTDALERFARVGGFFLGEAIALDSLELICL